ncbi:hypothetical protein [Streptomyces sp. NPDC040750]|uniref:hypothetical protein n=1 Tax=Streptomyces sp. NPDC040750 TaxID=3154491 RepID=UPI00340907FB
MAIASTAPVVASRCATTAGTVALVAPCDGSSHAEAFERRGWHTVAVGCGAPAPGTAAYGDSVEHRGSLRQTVKALRGLGVSAVVAGSAAGVGLADRIAWHLGMPLGDPETSRWRHDRGVQAPVLARAGIPVDDPRPVPTEWPPARRFVVNSVSRPGADGHPVHVVTDVWAETRSGGQLLLRTDLLDRHEPLTRVLSAFMPAVLDALGVMRGPVTARVAHDELRGPRLVSALAVPGSSPADEALRVATGYDRTADVLDTWTAPTPARRVPGPDGHRVVRVHLRRGGGAAGGPRLGHVLRRLPTVVAVSPALLGRTPPGDDARHREVVLSGGDPAAIEADYRTVRDVALGSVHGERRH